MPAYDATFSPGPGVNDVLQSPTGNSGLWTSQPPAHWSVTGSTLTGTPAGSAAAFLVRPSAEPFPPGTQGNALGGTLPAWGSSQAIIALTPAGGWGTSSAAWGLALNWSMPGSDPAQSTYYLAEFRPSTVTGRPSTLTITEVEAGNAMPLGTASWANDPTRDYDLLFEVHCECRGRPVYLCATAIDRTTAPPTLSDDPDVLAHGGAGVTVLAVTNAAPGLSNGLIGVPALVALPGTAGAPFVRVRLYNDSPARTFSGFATRPIGAGWTIGAGGSIVADQGTATSPAGLLLPL